MIELSIDFSMKGGLGTGDHRDCAGLAGEGDQSDTMTELFRKVRCCRRNELHPSRDLVKTPLGVAMSIDAGFDLLFVPITANFPPGKLAVLRYSCGSETTS